MHIDFITIIKYAWMDYDASRKIKTITDISAKVSTNHVYKVVFEDKSFTIAKLSYFGKYEHFVEDHTIINSLSTNLAYPFENFLSRALVKRNKIFVHRFKNDLIDAWVIFYQPVKIKNKLPRRLEDNQILKLAEQFALFHKACHSVRNTLSPSSKTLMTDVNHLLEILDSDFGRFEHRMNLDVLKKQSALFEENLNQFEFNTLDKIPVFVDWNIGNFSVTPAFKFYSRWDYDWFRRSSRMLDFYFISRIVSDVGDRTVFTYNIGPMMEDRFIAFLKKYHIIYPFRENEIRLLSEVYRFFILNYVIKDGRYFFHEIYATKFQKEAYDSYLPSIETFDAERLLKALNI